MATVKTIGKKNQGINRICKAKTSILLNASEPLFRATKKMGVLFTKRALVWERSGTS